MTRRATDLTGQAFSRLVVVSRHVDPAKRPQWVCRCACGTEKIVLASELRKGAVKSCGCLRKETWSKLISQTTHFHTVYSKRSPEYRAWESAKQRCFNPNAKGYANYGGRGIRMCDEWRSNFTAFITYMGPRPYGSSLDRINNNGNYEPGNCRWATRVVQRNNRRDSVIHR